ncbi:hypothetical protein PanWU01x14_333350, partial [Parasponia andersonii]
LVFLLPCSVCTFPSSSFSSTSLSTPSPASESTSSTFFTSFAFFLFFFLLFFLSAFTFSPFSTLTSTPLPPSPWISLPFSLLDCLFGLDLSFLIFPSGLGISRPYSLSSISSSERNPAHSN